MTEACKRNFLTLESRIFYIYVTSGFITLVKNEGHVTSSVNESCCAISNVVMSKTRHLTCGLKTEVWEVEPWCVVELRYVKDVYC